MSDNTANRPAPAGSTSGRQGIIGPSICIRGEITGEEDLVVQGFVEGTIKLPKNNVQLGDGSKAKASVSAKTVSVEGEIEGDLHGEELVVLKRSGKMRGNISAKRVVLEDGCRFTGSIDMEGNRAAGGAKVADIKKAADGGGKASS